MFLKGHSIDRLQRAEATFEPLPVDTAVARAYGRVYAAVGAAVVLLVSGAVTVRGMVHKRSLHRSTTGVPFPGPSTQRKVGRCCVTVAVESGAMSRGAATT